MGVRGLAAYLLENVSELEHHDDLEALRTGSGGLTIAVDFFSLVHYLVSKLPVEPKWGALFRGRYGELDDALTKWHLRLTEDFCIDLVYVIDGKVGMDPEQLPFKEAELNSRWEQDYERLTAIKQVCEESYVFHISFKLHHCIKHFFNGINYYLIF